ncbi:hypothetical protein SPRG_15009 [Saprolegnia parasitica CBS 223.65]|uniref:protein-tyrosine-phosphatase n=1 Tax=Saprolegnia parasitica (strain CBS 223.65) TaxID=695850 RepID=A0A067BQK0_SAPPC|nr:hypothetical protein SPRG_15009 [Saprolegnia parasitica CBS 223.65]KDO19055.1 hypothetical protein SPRG_15009 [Saprolegnia parasitica CBS 223.65]|eukprot:XP_012210243.1 hypothetical protein SPRG_15009 [Saprolegnia parasitica CBS 223.65]
MPIPLLGGSLYYVAYDAPVATSPDVLYLYADYRYIAYFEDFGPFHLGTTMQFCDDLSKLLAQAKREKKVVHVCTRHGLEEQANTVCLVGCYAVLCAGMTPADALRPFRDMQLAYFHDATDDECLFELSVFNVVEGFAKALSLEYVVRDQFRVADYVHHEQVEHGNWNWVTPRLLAFAGPSATTHPPSFFVPHFRRHNITLVVGLNERSYDANDFVKMGIEHVDLSFPDGSNPSDTLLRAFFEACDATPGAIAVHCKAGLGRTGTCIAAYLMQRDGFSAKQAIGWLRLCRPGSVIGPQQDFLVASEETKWVSMLPHAAEPRAKLPSAAWNQGAQLLLQRKRKHCSTRETNAGNVRLKT